MKHSCAYARVIEAIYLIAKALQRRKLAVDDGVTALNHRSYVAGVHVTSGSTS